MSARIFGLILFAGLVLAACASPKTGLSVRYLGVDTPVVDVVMPANAPTILAQFRNAPKPVAAGEPEIEHRGIDIIAARGWPIIAAAPGVVTASFYEPFFGQQVTIDHGKDAAGRQIMTHYYHMDSRIAEKGQRIARGAPVGRLGNSGIQGAKLHLHFEVTVDGKAIDPQLMWQQGVGRVTCFEPRRRIANSPIRLTFPAECT